MAHLEVQFTPLCEAWTVTLACLIRSSNIQTPLSPSSPLFLLDQCYNKFLRPCALTSRLTLMSLLLFEVDFPIFVHGARHTPEPWPRSSRSRKPSTTNASSANYHLAIHILPGALKAHQSTEDVAVPVEIQRMLIQGAEDAGANATSREIKSGHGVMLCRPKEAMEFITEAAALHETRQ